MSDILRNYYNVGVAPDTGLSAHWPVAGADLPAASKGFRRHWHRLGNLRHKGRNDILMIVQNAIYVATAQVTIANTVTETSLIGSGVGTKVLGTGSGLDYPLGVVGKRLTFRAWGHFSTKSAPVGTLMIRAYLGSTILLDSGLPAPPADLDNAPWRCDGDLTIFTVGATGTIVCSGLFAFGIGIQSVPTWWDLGNPANVPQPVTIDTTVSQTFELKVQWGTADVLNSITCRNFVLEYLF